jgi:hypothetical protein
LSVTLELDLLQQPDLLRGRVSDGHWVAELAAKRAVFDSRTNPAPQAGNYTLVIPGAEDCATLPCGFGIGSASVDTRGRIRFKGSAADGSKLTQSSVLSGDGQWPFYCPLYRGGGLAIGWLTFTNLPADDLSGGFAWIRPPQPGNPWFPNGFALETQAAGSRFQPPGSTNRILSFTNGLVAFEGGNLAVPFTNRITLAANNRVSNLDSNGLTLSFSASSGRFNGRATAPSGGRTFGFSGVVLQKRNLGAGFFLGTNQTGSVWVVPAN